jgi:hypothetical protein
MKRLRNVGDAHELVNPLPRSPVHFIAVGLPCVVVGDHAAKPNAHVALSGIRVLLDIRLDRHVSVLRCRLDVTSAPNQRVPVGPPGTVDYFPRHSSRNECGSSP